MCTLHRWARALAHGGVQAACADASKGGGLRNRWLHAPTRGGVLRRCARARGGGVTGGVGRARAHSFCPSSPVAMAETNPSADGSDGAAGPPKPIPSLPAADGSAIAAAASGDTARCALRFLRQQQSIPRRVESISSTSYSAAAAAAAAAAVMLAPSFPPFDLRPLSDCSTYGCPIKHALSRPTKRSAVSFSTSSCAIVAWNNAWSRACSSWSIVISGMPNWALHGCCGVTNWIFAIRSFEGAGCTAFFFFFFCFCFPPPSASSIAWCSEATAWVAPPVFCSSRSGAPT